MARRDVEDELAIVIRDALEDPQSGLAPALTAELAQLEFLVDDDLWRAAQLVAPESSLKRLELLADKRQLTGLSRAESQEVDDLLALADRLMLIRAQAAVLLKNRGHDIAQLNEPRRDE